MGWDPLCGSHDQLVATQSSLHHQLRYHDVSSGTVLSLECYQEMFVVEPSLLHNSEYILFSTQNVSYYVVFYKSLVIQTL